MSNPIVEFFSLPEAEQQRLRDIQDDPGSPFYHRPMGEIMRVTEVAAEAEDSHANDGETT